MSSTLGAVASRSPDHDSPITSPNHSPIKSRQSVRKRVTPAQTAGAIPPPLKSGQPNTSLHPRPRINPNLIYNEYKVHHNKGPLSWTMRFRNFVAVICMISFPLGIFVVPLWLHTSTYPRVVVAISTTMERLDQLESTVTSLMDEKLVPSISSIYVVVSKLDGEEIPAFLSDMAKITRKEQSDAHHSEKKPPIFQLLVPKPDYGHSTVYGAAIAALEAEQQWIERSKAADEEAAAGVLITEHSILKETGDLDGGETRLVIWDDRFLAVSSTATILSSIETLVKASQAYPDAVLSFMGGNWRSHFRQIQQQIGASIDESILLDKPPNVFLHGGLPSPPPSSMNLPDNEVDVLDATSGGVIFRVGRLLPEVPGFLARLQRLKAAFSTTTNEDDDSSDVIWEPEAGDVVWSGLLETQNISRMLVALTFKSSIFRGTTANATVSAMAMPSIIEPSRMHWMVAVLQLQVHWKIWTEYKFWDWSILTEIQLEAIECEGRYPQDCSEAALEGEDGGVGDEKDEEDAAASPNTDKTNSVCRPNVEYCSEYIDIFEVMGSNTEAT